MANFQKLQLSLILRVAGQIWQILQISAVICRILQIPPNSANSKLKFLSKKLAKVCFQKILQFNPKVQSGEWVDSQAFGEFAECFLEGRGGCLEKGTGVWRVGKQDGIIDRTVSF
jgi:hypothetical protein